MEPVYAAYPRANYGTPEKLYALAEAYSGVRSLLALGLMLLLVEVFMASSGWSLLLVMGMGIWAMTTLSLGPMKRLCVGFDLTRGAAISLSFMIGLSSICLLDLVLLILMRVQLIRELRKYGIKGRSGAITRADIAAALDARKPPEAFVLPPGHAAP